MAEVRALPQRAVNSTREKHMTQTGRPRQRGSQAGGVLAGTATNSSVQRRLLPASVGSPPSQRGAVCWCPSRQPGTSWGAPTPPAADSQSPSCPSRATARCSTSPSCPSRARGTCTWRPPQHRAPERRRWASRWRTWSQPHKGAQTPQGTSRHSAHQSEGTAAGQRFTAVPAARGRQPGVPSTRTRSRGRCCHAPSCSRC